jgi:hypothetical protein
MKRRIVVVSSAAPGTGGGSTTAGAFFRWLPRAAFDAVYLGVVEERDQDWLAYTCGPAFDNPEGRDDVHAHLLRDGPGEPALDRSVGRLKPEVVVAVGARAGSLLHGVSREYRTLLLATGFGLVDARPRELALGGLLESVGRGRGVGARPDRDTRRAVEAADLILAHETGVHRLHAFFFPHWTGKLHPEVVGPAEWIRHEVSRHAALALPWEARDIDVLFAAAHWNAPAKGGALLHGILPGLAGLNVVVLGEATRELRGAHCAGLVADRRRYLGILGRARTVVCPSRFETSSTVLFEASGMGCNVVASEDCGNAALCHPELRIEKPTPREFVERIQRSLLAKLEDRHGDFLRSEANEGLLETLEVL